MRSVDRAYWSWIVLLALLALPCTALADAIVMLSNHSDHWAQMGRAGRRIVHQRFNLKTQIARLEKIYQGLLS